MITPEAMDRRKFLRRLARRILFPCGMLFGSLTGGYGLLEARRCGVYRVDLAPRNLPGAFDGMTIALVADTHHGPMVPLDYIEHVVAMTNDLRPDLVMLGGDYVDRRRREMPGGDHRRYIRPAIEALAKLRAPMGRFAVLGNHDHLVDAGLTRRALADHGITDLTNTGVWFERGGARMRLCGLDDMGRGTPLLPPAFGDMTAADASVVVTHNPDLVEYIRDPRVDLVLSGHTHGGQVVFPYIGAPVTASQFGQKYLQGLRQGPTARVFVTRGVGTTGLPIRYACPPEVALITLRRPSRV